MRYGFPPNIAYPLLNTKRILYNLSPSKIPDVIERENLELYEFNVSKLYKKSKIRKLFQKKPNNRLTFIKISAKIIK